MQDDIRLGRLQEEFDLMRALLKPHALIEFWVADLTAEEAPQFLRTKFSFDVITDGFPGFLTPAQFAAQFVDVPPEKYMIRFNCKGLWQLDDGKLVEAPYHLMEVVFGADYPSRPPTFIWLTPIWHPNLRRPYICLEGRPFAVGWTLDLIVQEVGRLVQYQSYNVNDPLNSEAAEWARQNADRFPIDDRYLLDSRHKVSASSGAQSSERAADPASSVQMDDPDNLIEIVP